MDVPAAHTGLKVTLLTNGRAVLEAQAITAELVTVSTVQHYMGPNKAPEMAMSLFQSYVFGPCSRLI